MIVKVIDNGLASDCDVSSVLIMTHHRFCKKDFPKKLASLKSVLYLLTVIIFDALRRL